MWLNWGRDIAFFNTMHRDKEINVSLSGHLLLRLPLFCESYINGEFGLLILRESLLVPQKKNNEIMTIIMKGVPEV